MLYVLAVILLLKVILFRLYCQSDIAKLSNFCWYR